MQPASIQPEQLGHRLHHDFWPPLPWPEEPSLPHLDLGEIDQEMSVHGYAWLATKTHQIGEDEQLWHGAKVLGVGGYGAAGLWIQADATKHIVDRMVIKETKRFSPVEWGHPKNWRNHLPQEIRVHQLIEERRAADTRICRHLVHMRAHRLFIEQMEFRLYLNFYAGGTLWDAMGHYDANWKKGPAEGRISENVLPEAYIWYVLHALTEACTLLQKGTLEGGVVDGWNSITHLDLQLANVFLDVSNRQDAETDAGKGKGKAASDADAHPILPPVIPVLEDFGMSFFSPINNPEDHFIGPGNPTYPPEMQSPNLPENVPLGEATDVWGIGRIAWQLIVNRYTNYGPVRDEIDTEPNKYEGFIPLSQFIAETHELNDRNTTLTGAEEFYPAAARYSDQLRDLVCVCLNLDTIDRPSLEQIRGATTTYFEETQGAMDVVRDRDGLGLRFLKMEKFEIGEVFESKKRKRSGEDIELPT